ncbi:unnamed protein product, partial [Owenia fusiformis]
ETGLLRSEKIEADTSRISEVKTAAMRVICILIALGLVVSIERKRRRACIPHPTVTCERNTIPKWNCPNAYKCKKTSGNCCRYKSFPKGCRPEIDSTGTPYKCRGGGSQRCSAGYVCVSDPSGRNLFSVCCEDFICYDKSAKLHRAYEGQWTEPDGCTVCTCESHNNTKCDDSRCVNRCGKYSDFSSCPLKTCGKQVQIRKCTNSNSNTISQRNAELNMVVCHPKSPAQCPQPGVALTESIAIIFGGNEVMPVHNYRWMVHFSSQGQVHCGGSIISPIHILTAAHCFVNGLTFEKMSIEYIARFIKVETGKHDLRVNETYEQIPTIKSVTLHEGYNTYSFGYNNEHDIAIVTLDSPLQFNLHTHPIKLPTGNFNNHTIKKLRKGICKVLGWGMVSKTTFSNVLMMIQINIENECNLKSNKDKERVTDNMFCASAVDPIKIDRKLDSCRGDSGGPFMCREGTTWYQYGIVSWGPRTCGKQSGVYIKVPNYIDWITKIISTPGGWGE